MSLASHKICLCTASTRRRFKDNLQGDSQMLLKRRLRLYPHAANAKRFAIRGKEKTMGQITLRMDNQDCHVLTVPGSARLKILAPAGLEFYFDPGFAQFRDATASQSFSPESAGLDAAKLTEELLQIDAQRRGEIQKSNLDQTIPGGRATLYDNGDFRYFVYLDPVQSPVGGFALTITSQWKSSAKPAEEQFRFRACLEREGLERLQALIQRELT